MSTHCKLGDTQSIVNYKFGDSSFKNVVIKNAPITVTTTRDSTGATENFSREGFGIRFYSPNNRIWVQTPVHDYRIFPSEDFEYGTNYEGIALWSCGYNDFDRNSDGSLNGAGVDITTITFLPDLKCPKPLDYEPKYICSIKAEHNGVTVLSESGDCPINYSVTCGEECPPGTIKCFSTNYPGYCCLSCNEIKAEIQAITNQVKSLNES